MNLFHAVDDKCRFEVVDAPLREGGVCTTLRAGEGLVNTCPQGKCVDALLAVVVTTGAQYLGISVVLMADITHDILLQLFNTLLHNYYFSL